MKLSPSVLAAIQSVLLAKWSLFSAGITSALINDWTLGYFQTWPSTKSFILSGGWWTILVGGGVGAVIGAAVRGQQKASYVTSVQEGTANSASSHVFVDATTPIVKGAPSGN